jgi:hypothetical protein
MTRGGVAETYNIASSRFQAEHCIETGHTMRVAVRDIQVVRTCLYIRFIEISLRVVILEVMEHIENIIQGRFEFF